LVTKSTFIVSRSHWDVWLGAELYCLMCHVLVCAVICVHCSRKC